MTRPTPRGIGVSIAALTCAITGLIWSIPQLFAVAIAASVLMLLAAVLGRGGGAVRWTLSAPQRVSRNDPVCVSPTLRVVFIQHRGFRCRWPRYPFPLNGEELSPWAHGALFARTPGHCSPGLSARLTPSMSLLLPEFMPLLWHTFR